MVDMTEHTRLLGEVAPALQESSAEAGRIREGEIASPVREIAPLYAGQRLLVTTDGTRALAAYKPPTTAPARTTAVTPPATQRATGRKR